MKRIYSILIIGAVAFTALSSANADSDTTASGTISVSGNTMTGQYKNRGELMKDTQERLKKMREELKQKREEMRNRRSGSGAYQTGTTLTAEQLACVRAAVAKRETGVLAAFITLSATTNSGYVTRATALNTAWTLSGKTDRKTAIDTAWRNWKNAMRTARDIYKTTHKSVLSTFRTEAQACKVPEALADASNESDEIRIGDN